MADAAAILVRLEALRELRATGTKRTRIEDEEVEFKTDAEMRAAIADLENQLAALGGRRSRTIRFATSKGLDR